MLVSMGAERVADLIDLTACQTVEWPQGVSTALARRWLAAGGAARETEAHVEPPSSHQATSRDGCPDGDLDASAPASRPASGGLEEVSRCAHDALTALGPELVEDQIDLASSGQSFTWPPGVNLTIARRWLQYIGSLRE